MRAFKSILEINGGVNIIKIRVSPTGTLTTPYGVYDSKHVDHAHHGLDFACPEGYPIHSPIEGIVSRIVREGSGNKLGNGVFVKTDSGYQFIFGHLSTFNTESGQHVNTGEVIGFCGSTGRAYGSHVHFGSLDPTGHFINPQVALQHVKTSSKEVFEIVFDWLSDIVI